MKYKPSNQRIPMDRRKAINDKILYLVDQDAAEESGITREDIFNAYTGDGGLHGLDRADFANYHEFAEAKKEIENGQFFTPDALCRFIMEAINPGVNDTVADLTSGIASFCNYMPTEANFYGCELDIKSHKVAHYLYPAAQLTYGDIRAYNPDMRFDFVVGNPPFNLKWNVDDTEWLSQMYYCVKAAELLKPLGIMGIVVPASFLADDFTDGGKIREMEKRFRFLGQISVEKNAFSHLGVTGYGTKVMFWQKHLTPDEAGSSYTTECAGAIEDLQDCAAVLEQVRSVMLSPAAERAKQERLHVRMLRSGGNDSPFTYQVRKMLYQISSNPRLRDKYARCQEYVHRFENQRQPDNMKYEEWQKIKLTEAKVLAYLRRTLKEQSKPAPVDKTCFVKHKYSFAYKAYSPKTRKQLADWMKTPTPIYQAVTDPESVEIPSPYARLIRRKQREHNRETMPFSEMKPDAKITDYLDDFIIFNSADEEEIRLNDRQKQDINLILQKKYHLLQWQQGSGKTLAGIAVGNYRMKFQGAKNVWVVSTAISIHNNWEDVMPAYGLPHRSINRLSDLDQIQNGEFVLITLNMLTKYCKQVKRHIRMQNQKVCLVFDESDEMTNPQSKRTKAVLDCFRRVRWKLAMTGTVTRNNISESAPQFELLYNNSYNFMSDCQWIYRYEKDDAGEMQLRTEPNDYYGKPIPAYAPGYSLFAASHLPAKITVFGQEKRTQDIFNADELNALLSYSVITRTFEEIVGKEIRRMHQINVRFTPPERAVYHQAVSEFERIRMHYFSSTGNSRKDSMMKLIQQITLLLRISAAPNTMAEYDSEDAPAKLDRVAEMIASFPDEIVAVGVRHQIVVDAYAALFRERFPDRPLFVVTGSTMSLKKRKALRKTLRESRNGILICTQQSLPSSVNFEYVNKIIIPELHYNDARMSQFYFRFIRYTSTDWKDIFFVTYSGSLEANLMQMVLAKEKLNLFMKGKDVDLDEIYERYGIDYDLMSQLMRREADEEGHFHIRWGEQTIA